MTRPPRVAAPFVLGALALTACSTTPGTGATAPAATTQAECDTVTSTYNALIAPWLTPASAADPSAPGNLTDGLRALLQTLATYQDPYSQALDVATTHLLVTPMATTAQTTAFTKAVLTFQTHCPADPATPVRPSPTANREVLT